MLASLRRGARARLATFAAVSTIVPAAMFGGLVASAGSAAAAGACATPGGSGAGGTLSGVVNTYYPGVGTASAGGTSISVGAPSGAATAIASGDLLLVVQMQAADINSTNTDAYGDGVAAVPASGYTALNASGLYEYVRATSAVVAGSVGVSGLGAGAGLLNSYTSAAATATAGQRTFQVVRVPQYTTATTGSTLTAAAWNGSVGGVLAVDTTSTLTLNGTVSVDGLGFRGALGINRTGGAGLLNTDVAVSATAGANGNKGEGIAGVSTNTTTTNSYPGGDTARGAPGNAGGGGTDGNPGSNDQNSGGGGGGNGGAGGLGGNTWSSNLARGGYGGVAVPATSARVFLGGGGGAGTDNNHTAPQSNGAPGGGIVFIRAGSVAGAGSITANGAAANNITLNDGGGGGGAGGTIVLTTPSASLAAASLSANGGRGGDAWDTQTGAGEAHGPGGGGGGGWIFTSSAPTASSVVPGANGITTTGNLAFGSSPGVVGKTATASPAAIPGVSGGAECADLSITKTGPVNVNANGTVSYQLTVANAGPSDAVGLSVLDTLPAGVIFGSATGLGWTCLLVGSTVTCNNPTLASGATAGVITVVVTAPAQGATLVNAASVTSTTPDPRPANNTASATTTVTPVADLNIAKSGPVSVLAGGSISYTLAVNNIGPSDAAGVSVVDTLPPGVTFGSVTAAGWACTNTSTTVTCTRPLIAAGTPAPPITVVVTAPTVGATLTNTAKVSTTTLDPNSGNDTATATTSVTPSADLSIVKTGPATVVAGGTVSYGLSVSNAGPSNAVNLVVSDTLPAGATFVSASGSGWTCTPVGATVSCTLGALAPGGPPSVVTVVVTAPAQATSLSNTATVSSATSDPNPLNNTSTANTTVTASADLSIVKSGPSSVVAGAPITYTLLVRNGGPSDAANLLMTDNLPAGVTFGSAGGTGWTCTHIGDVSVACTQPALAAGVTAEPITVVVTAPNQSASLTNSASIATTTNDPVPGNNTSLVDTTVTASADLAITKVGPATVVAGTSVSYAVSVVNNGPSDAADVVVSDTLPAGVTFVSAGGPGWLCNNTANTSVACDRTSFAAGATSLITVVVTAPVQGATLTNSATITATTADPKPGNNFASASTNVTASADLAITKSGPLTVVAGASISYSLTVVNNGPSDAADATVRDTLPAGVTFVSAAGPGWTCSNIASTSVTCVSAAVPAGATSVITVVVRAPAQAGSIANTATVSSTTADPNGTNNSSVATTSVTASADVSIVKSGPATVVAGSDVTYTLVVTNSGPSDADTVSVADALPAGVTFVSADGVGWTCTNNGDISVTCDRSLLAAGTTAAPISVVVTAPGQAASLTNTASVSTTTADPNPANNTSIKTTAVTASADLAITKTGPLTATAGSDISYVIAVANNGPSNAANVSVVDLLPAGVNLVSVSGPGWSCSSVASTSVTCNRLTMAKGAAIPNITIVVTAPSQPGSLLNRSTIASTTADPVPGNNFSNVVTAVQAVADLSITKTGPATVVAAGTVAYQLGVSNLGPSDSTLVSVTDTLPAGVTFVSATGTDWTCGNSGNVTVTCTLPALAAGDTAATIIVVVRAPAQGATLTNTADVSATTSDPNPADNTASATTTVTPSADLSLLKQGPAQITSGTTVNYRLLVSNAGPSDAHGVSVTDTLPPGVTFLSATGSGWTCTHVGSQSVTCTRPTVAVGVAVPTIAVVVQAPTSAVTLSNVATVSASTPDPLPQNNSAAVSTSVVPTNISPGGPPAPGTPSDGGGGGTLPQTGSDVLGLGVLGLAFLVLGLSMLWFTRRRT